MGASELSPWWTLLDMCQPLEQNDNSPEKGEAGAIFCWASTALRLHCDWSVTVAYSQRVRGWRGARGRTTSGGGRPRLVLKSTNSDHGKSTNSDIMGNSSFLHCFVLNHKEVCVKNDEICANNHEFSIWNGGFWTQAATKAEEKAAAGKCNINAKLPRFLLLKMQKWRTLPLKHDDFVLKNGRIVLQFEVSMWKSSCWRWWRRWETVAYPSTCVSHQARPGQIWCYVRCRIRPAHNWVTNCGWALMTGGVGGLGQRTVESRGRSQRWACANDRAQTDPPPLIKCNFARRSFSLPGLRVIARTDQLHAFPTVRLYALSTQAW